MYTPVYLFVYNNVYSSIPGLYIRMYPDDLELIPPTPSPPWQHTSGRTRGSSSPLQPLTNKNYLKGVLL